MIRLCSANQTEHHFCLVDTLALCPCDPHSLELKIGDRVAAGYGPSHCVEREFASRATRR